MSRLLTTAEACARLNRHPSWFSKQVKLGNILPAHKAPGIRGAFFFAAADVDALAAKLVAQSEAGAA